MMEAGKTYKILVTFKYDVYETIVKCLEVFPKSYRVIQNGNVRLIKKSDLSKADEIQDK